MLFTSPSLLLLLSLSYELLCPFRLAIVAFYHFKVDSDCPSDRGYALDFPRIRHAYRNCYRKTGKIPQASHSWNSHDCIFFSWKVIHGRTLTSPPLQAPFIDAPRCFTWSKTYIDVDGTIKDTTTTNYRIDLRENVFDFLKQEVYLLSVESSSSCRSTPRIPFS